MNEENVALTDETLDQVAGGVRIPPQECLNDLERKKPGRPAEGSISPSYRMI